jgi:arabinan endo-1,5-alpha-L-arabinosidase
MYYAGGPLSEYRNPVLDREFPDPNVIRASDGWCYAYATQAPPVNVQLARSRDMVRWEHLGDAMPQKPVWAQTTQMFWAPHVVEHGGTFFMYFTASPDDPQFPGPPDDPTVCLGVATSASPEGPFTDIGAPLHAGPTTSDIDADVFCDPATGRWHLAWGSGGDIVLRELAADLVSLAPGSEQRLLLRGWSAEPKLPYEEGIEGPYLTERDGWWYLWYSGDRTWTYPPHYAVMVARSRSPEGPFERGGIVLGDGDRWLGPGHNSVVRDDAGDDWIVYHAIDSQNPWEAPDQVRRVMLIDRITYRGGWPQITPSAGAPAPAPNIGA